MKKMLVMMLTLAMIFTMIPAVNAATQQDSDLVAYWTFDELTEDGMVEDMSGNGNTLFMVDTAYATIDGFSGKTFNFNGGTSAYDNSKHLVMSSDDLANQINGSEGLTFSYFMKKKVLESNTNMTMFAFRPGMDGVVAYANKEKMATNCRSGGGAAVSTSTTVAKVYANSHANNLPELWTHVAWVFDYPNDNVKIYVDGVLVGEEKAEATPQKFAEDVATYRTDVNDIANGYFGVGGRTTLVDEFKIYKRALTQDEIKESVPPVMSYDFEEVCDGTIKDLSAQGRDITVAADDTPEVVYGGGVNGSNTIRLQKIAYFPEDTFTKMFFGTKAYSLSMWVKCEHPSGIVGRTGAYQFIKDASEAGKASLFAFSNNQRKFYLETRAQTIDRVGYVQSVDCISYSADRNWHHIYIEADFANKTGKFYIDGVQKNLNNCSVANASLGYVTGTIDHLPDIFNIADKDMLFDDLKIYRRTLTEAEIQKEAKNLLYNISNTASTVTVSNITGIAADSQLILAMYDKETGAFVDCNITTATTTHDRVYSVGIDEIDAPANYTYKLFVWNANNVPLKHLQTFTVSAQ